MGCEMRIRRIYFGDFGIFQNQTLEPLGPGLVVIGGLNRAGKTTFMAALRYLGYGIPKSRGFPPAVKNYELRADLEKDGFDYSIFVSGYGYPSVIGGKQAPEITAQALYNNLDRFTYKQIFTISLDELRQIPESVGDGDEGKIGAVLLGAGWDDALRLIQLIERLNKEASDIGGKYGRISTKKFHPYYEILCEGLEMRDRANEEMDRYEEKCSKLEEIGTVLIPSVENKLGACKRELQRLELLLDRYTKYHVYKGNKQVLEEEENRRLLETFPPGGVQQAESLKEEYKTALDADRAARERFASVNGFDADPELQEKLLEAGRYLDGCAVRISGWEARVQVLKSIGEELERKNNELKRDLAQLYAPWREKEPLIAVNFVVVDQDLEQKMQQAVILHRDLQNELKQQDRHLVELESELEALKSRLQSLPPVKRGLVRKVVSLALADLLAIIFLSFVLPPAVAVAAGVAGAVAILAFFLKENSIEEAKVRQIGDLVKEIDDRQTRKEGLMERSKHVSGELEILNGSIARMREEAHIPPTVDIAFLPDFVRNIRHLQHLSGEILMQKEKFERLKKELMNELAPVKATLKSINMLDGENEDVVEESTIIFDRLARSFSCVKEARELRNAENVKAAVEKKIIRLMEKEDPFIHERLEGQSLYLLLEEFIRRGYRFEELTEKRRDNNIVLQVLISDLDTERWRERLLGEEGKKSTDAAALLAALADWYEEFTSKQEIKERYSSMEMEIKTLETELQHLKDEKRDLAKEVEELGSDSRLLSAKQQIDLAQIEIRSILEKYAIRRVAAFMLQQVKEKLLEKTRETLLAPASEVFRKMTGSAYRNIELHSGNGEATFNARLANGKEQSVDALSRATREQLFFSMRLGRIRDIKPELPVILDDTFTNFDPIHTREAVKFLVELADTHQVFVLTCHPELLEYIQKYGAEQNIQFWKLKEGRFSGPFDTCSEVRSMLLQG